MIISISAIDPPDVRNSPAVAFCHHWSRCAKSCGSHAQGDVSGVQPVEDDPDRVSGDHLVDARVRRRRLVWWSHAE
jgi:hypothetical protein